MSFRCGNAISKRKLYVFSVSPVVQTRTKVSAKMYYLALKEVRTSQTLLVVPKNMNGTCQS